MIHSTQEKELPGIPMNHHQFIDRLDVNAGVFKSLFQDLTDKQARWKPDANRWSILEVINHLYDEEREDFRQRLDLTLNHPQKEWPPIDPEGWITERGYNDRDLSRSLQNFFEERQRSLEWLNDLAHPDWQTTHRHPPIGTMSAEQILANWLAHDLFHIRQITDLHFAWLTRSAAPISLAYSGWEL